MGHWSHFLSKVQNCLLFKAVTLVSFTTREIFIRHLLLYRAKGICKFKLVFLIRMAKLHSVTAVLLCHIFLGESTNHLVHWISYLADRFINRGVDIDLNHLQKNHWIFCNVRKLQFPVAVESFKDTSLRRKDVPSRISRWTRIALLSSGRKTEYIFIRFKLYDLQVMSGC